jgi:hypothetical protein
MEKMEIYSKNGAKWEKTGENKDAIYIYKRVAFDLIAKKINNASYIKSIKRINLYTGYQQIIAYYDNGVKAVYTIKNGVI